MNVSIVSMSLPIQLIKKIRRIAKQNQRSLSYMVRIILEEYVKSHDNKDGHTDSSV